MGKEEKDDQGHERREEKKETSLGRVRHLLRPPLAAKAAWDFKLGTGSIHFTLHVPFLDFIIIIIVNHQQGEPLRPKRDRRPCNSANTIKPNTNSREHFQYDRRRESGTKQNRRRIGGYASSIHMKLERLQLALIIA